MANKRKPDNLHLLQNTYKPSIHGDLNKKPKLESKLPTMPEWLDTEAQVEWKRICGVLEKANMLTIADQSILALYCALYSEFQRTGDKFPVGKYGQFRLTMVELGLTPSARSKITVEPNEPDF